MGGTDFDSALFREASYVDFENFLKQNNIAYSCNHPLNRYTTFRVGGNADFFVTPATATKLAQLQLRLIEQPLPTFILGGGSNLLVSDLGFHGVVIHPELGEEIQIIHQSTDRLKAFVPASARAPLAAKKISALGFSGFEFLTTIPGHFGGSVIQNAGCYGHELKDSIIDVSVAHAGNVISMLTTECNFQYRSSLFKNIATLWVAGATLELASADVKIIDERIVDYKNRRIASQPKNRRSAGSIFKNPTKQISEKKSWQLIEEAGLRGVKERGAEISAEHCNFIVNTGGARADEIYKLMQLIEQRVFDNSGIRLEREIVLVGKFGENTAS